MFGVIITTDFLDKTVKNKGVKEYCRNEKTQNTYRKKLSLGKSEIKEKLKNHSNKESNRPKAVVKILN